jgi:HSP20 family protein
MLNIKKIRETPTTLVKKNFIDDIDTMANNFVRRFLDSDIVVPFTDNNGIGSVNVKETETSYNLEVLVPGFEKENVTISINGDNLEIVANHEESAEECDDCNCRKEYSKNSFTRSFFIPDNVDKDKIDADLKNGILKITLSKTEPIKVRKNIVIKN